MEAATQQPRNQYYISSGAKNAQFTLRVRFEEWAQHGGEAGLVTRDQYVANLGINISRAKTKAAVIAGEQVNLCEVSGLNAYGEADIASAAARAEAIEASRKRQLAIDHEMTEKLRIRREADAKSQWQGTLGERITRTLTCCRWIPTYEGQYGMRYVAIFVDSEMNKYVFFGAGCLSLPGEGDTWAVTFNVSNHSERDGAKQTIIKRPAKAKGGI